MGTRRPRAVWLWLGLAWGGVVGAQEKADLQTTWKVLQEAIAQWPRERLEVGFLPLLPPGDERALRRLAEGGREGVAYLGQLLQHPHPTARAWAARILGEIGSPEAFLLLVKGLKDSEPAVRFEAGQALGYLGNPSAIPALEEAIQREKVASVGAALRSARTILKEIQQVRELPSPQERLREWIRLLGYRYAVEQVVGFGSEAVPWLLEALRASQEAQAAGAAQALALLGDERGIEPLLELALQTRKSFYARALAEYPTPSVVPALKRLLESDDFSLEYWALQGLKRWKPPETQSLLLAYLERRMKRNWHRKPMLGNNIPVNTLAEACSLLAEVGDEKALPILRRLVNEAPAGQNIVHDFAAAAYRQIRARQGGSEP